MTMKALAISMILSLLTTGGAAAYAVQTQASAEPAAQSTAVSQTVVCSNDGVPALDGTGYQGGRSDENGNGNGNSGNGGYGVCANGGVCVNETAPHDGVPARDGTGYRGGRG